MPLVHSNLALDAFCATLKEKFVESPSYGVLRLMLDRDGDEKARCTTIVKYLPNASFPEHSHTGGEEFLVLEGSFHDENGSYPKGTYVRNPIDSKHSPFVKEDGCVILVKLWQMTQKEKRLVKHGYTARKGKFGAVKIGTKKSRKGRK